MNYQGFGSEAISQVVAQQPVKSKTATSHLVQSSQFARRLAKLLLYGLFVAVFAMMFLPWQQTSRGSGQVVAYVPQERQQSVEAPTKGVVVRIGEGLVEGSEVKKGQFLLEIQPFAANMREQLEGQLSDLKAKLGTANTSAEVYGDMMRGLTEARDFSISAAQDMVAAAKAKLEAKEKQVGGYVAKELQAQLNHDRQLRLSQKGLKPEREVEKLRKEWDVAKADLESVKKEVVGLEKELTAKQSKLEETRRVAQTKVDYPRAMQQDALGKAATIQKDIREVQMKLDAMKRNIINAPRDGTIFRMPVYEQGQAIKEGDPICTLIPETSQKAVELFINGNDMPLVEVGQEVRLQFEGWPGVQFAGWPSVAIGTFSGIVTNVDATDNGKGSFRILVTPNEDEQAWPSDKYLRQGVRANGWVMLREVKLGYEIWRQLNGFPVIMSEDEPTDKKKDAKPPKLPK